MLQKKADKLEQNASKRSHLLYHYIHAEHVAAVKLYCSTLELTKSSTGEIGLKRQ